MNSNTVRDTFLKFFKEKSHQIVPSAPIVNTNDPTLMFVNAGMNQFKDYFLGNQIAVNKRVADTQKCLRVSGKHNDIEEVGVDTYHHTMFEMLGNWSFGDYFKKEAIEWAWELLTQVYKMNPERLYASVFEGDAPQGLEADNEAAELWQKILPKERILFCSKKDNFWEMGETGPCGPCSEIHVDLRSDEERAKIDGALLVNQDHPEVIEIWNLVFIQFNRLSNGTLEELPEKHVDTGMGFERLCMALQGKKSSYDTDIFSALIAKVEEITGHQYGKTKEIDIAIRVIVDHIRAISFTINDGQLPSNTGAGYVIRRILRRAVRYAYSNLNFKEMLLNQLVAVLAEKVQGIFPEIKANQDFIAKVIAQEETAFLRTLSSGLKRFEQIADSGRVEGKAAFELYDTYGFPIDLTRLLAAERSLAIDEVGFETEMAKQKQRARSAAELQTDDWMVINDTNEHSRFVGYDCLETTTHVVRYRKVTGKKKALFQIVLAETPFYAESGGQVGDTGVLKFGEEEIQVNNTKKENELWLHYTEKLPAQIDEEVTASVNSKRRKQIASNHTATHILHAALREVLGEHVHQKGSLVAPTHLRFDFSHFSKVELEQLKKIEARVNEKVRENIEADIREMTYDEAIELGAMALFGEKYGDKVRVVTFDPNFSVELCGGTHVGSTAEIGFCKITTETSVAAGVRRIELVSGEQAYSKVENAFQDLTDIGAQFKNSRDLVKSVQQLVAENGELRKSIEKMSHQLAKGQKAELQSSVKSISDVSFLAARVDLPNADSIKKLAYELKSEVPDIVLVLAAKIKEKPLLTVALGDSALEKGWNASTIIRSIASKIQGGGGGQPFYATAGGKNAGGLQDALVEAEKVVKAGLAG